MLYSIIFTSLLSVWSAVVYRIYQLNNMGVVMSLILAIFSFICLLHFNKKHNIFKLNNKRSYHEISLSVNGLKKYLLLFIYCLLYIFCLYILLKFQTTESIASPWQVIPDYFFLLYSLATITLIIIILKQPNKMALGLISAHYFLSFSIALIIYKIGYGFDPFIHQAGINLIDKTGVIFPKTFYYLGQYGLEVILHKITSIPLVLIDKLLVPFLTALFLPGTIFCFSQKWFQDKKINLFILIFLLTLPFSLFIITVPQNLAYLFLLITILFGLICSNILELIIVYLFAFACFAIHPIAGIPAILFTIVLTVYHNKCLKNKAKKYLYLLIYILSSIALPLCFYFIHLKNNQQSLSLIKNNFLFPLFPKIIIPNQENFILNFIYLYGFNIKIILALLIGFGILIVYRHKTTKIFDYCIYMAFSLLIAFSLTKLLPFNFLIEYERDNYTDRIFIIIVLFLIPFIIILFHWLIEKILKQKKIIQVIWFLFLITIVTSSLYLSYPCFDNYYNSHSWSTGYNDIATVRWIENNARQNYIVLANQQVSAAALKEFGFNRYLTITKSSQEIYFYPIPTGGQLYQYYLDMVYKKPNRKTALKAMDFAGVNKVYFVLNKYWGAFPKILDEAKLEANAWHKINEGEVYVFEYIR